MKTSLIDYLLSSLSIAVILLISLLFLLWMLSGQPISYLNFVPILAFLCLILAYGLLTAIFLKVLRHIAPFTEGRYSMEHRQFTLWKLHAVLMQLGLPCLKLFIPIFLRPLLYGLLGARIGRQTAIGGKLVDPYLTVMEDHSVIGEDSVVTAHIMTHDQFILGRVTIGRKATVGVKAVIMPGVEIGENAIVLPNSVVSLNTRIPANEIWGGNPAKKIKEN